MILKGLVGNFTLDLPEPAIKQRIAPADFVPFDDYPELSGYVGLDTETDDPGISAGLGSSWARAGEGSICGFSIAYRIGKETKSFYVGLNHAGGNSDAVKALSWLRHQAWKPDVTFVYANALYDLGWLRRNGVVPANVPIDVQGMAALLDSDRYSYSLDSLMWDYLKRRKSTDGLRQRAREYGIDNPYLHMRRLPTWDVAPYAIDDVVGTLDLFYEMLPKLEAEDLMRVFKLECETLLVALDLRWNGVRVDQDEMAQVRASFEAKRQGAIDAIQGITGTPVSLTDPTSMARALEAEDPTLKLERTGSGIPSIRIGVLDALGTPVAQHLREGRRYDKAITTTLVGLERHVGKDGRVHAEFHPLRKSRDDEKGEGSGLIGVGPGRWSSSNPNLQNIPRREPDVGVPIRRCFKAEEGEDWMKADYSSQEPRLATHFAYQARGIQGKYKWRAPERHQRGIALPGAEELVRLYREDPEMSFHKYVGKRMGVYGTEGSLMTYDQLKVVNLALIYGMSGATFCKALGLPTKWEKKSWGGEGEYEAAGDVGQELLDLHAKAVPWGKALANIAMDAATKRGYVKTVLGRRIRYLRRYADGRLMDANKALNTAIQGSAADQMKTAQVLMRRAGIQPLVVVHDDANISIPRGDAGQRRKAEVEEIMAHAIELVVPSLAEIEIGANWGEVSKPKNWKG